MEFNRGLKTFHNVFLMDKSECKFSFGPVACIGHDSQIQVHGPVGLQAHVDWPTLLLI